MAEIQTRSEMVQRTAATPSGGTTSEFGWCELYLNAERVREEDAE